ncbi:DUF4921 family protein [Arsenicicoccus dermatophilus]|uniref:DUF4921 family protein n=1 Tax=Arsenicicoccus dermatophilus TaxID=1076331 RepID=UPI001F4C640B|nr:DUF4921 family protein [Arsenicicoccus dermatophilus]MCH8612262.1 DUF4921 family protein [Arsenicicoccus dermatophilus]
MTIPRLPDPAYLTRLADGTVKQLNPFTGTQVWTVPGRGNRPVGSPVADPVPVTAEAARRLCAFCEDRQLETPPEKSRLVRGSAGPQILRGVLPGDLGRTTAQFRRVPNLFEILSYDYWHLGYGYELPRVAREHRDAYLADPDGRAHVLAVARAKALASGTSPADRAALDEDSQLAGTTGFFGGGHDVIVGRRHLVDGATDTGQLASSGTLTVVEHRDYLALTLDALRDLYDTNRFARYVAVFQNWLRPAGASFDHLHKQLVAIDERGVQTEQEIARLRANLNLFNEAGPDYAAQHGLVLADTEHAVAYAGFGHRYPTVEIVSRSATSEPWRQSEQEQTAMADLIHAVHAATGPDIPCNEEWHHRPVDVDVPMPWRVLVKWRVSTLAGFEGGTKINVNTISPWALRDRLLPRLHELRAAGAIGADLRLGEECDVRPCLLRYNPLLRLP